MINVKKILEEDGVLIKFNGISPEGFILVHKDTLEELKDFEVWKEWKHDKISIKELNNKHFVKV
jgi:hypothetical protein